MGRFNFVVGRRSGLVDCVCEGDWGGGGGARVS